MNALAGINYLAVAVATVVYFFIGFIWYSVLFRQMWSEETGVVMGGEAKPQVVALVGQFVSTFLYALGVALVIRLYGAGGIAAGVHASILVILLFVIPMNSGNLFFTGKKRLFLLDVCERAVGTLVIGIIVGAWR